MPPLDSTTRDKIIRDYRDIEQKEPDSYSDRWSNDPDDDIWGTGKIYKLTMGVALNIPPAAFDPNNPVFTDEPNLDAATTEYDLQGLGGWLVIVGSSPQHTYVVRKADANYSLRDTNHSAETTYHNDAGGNQVRRRTGTNKHVK